MPPLEKLKEIWEVPKDPLLVSWRVPSKQEGIRLEIVQPRGVDAPAIPPGTKGEIHGPNELGERCDCGRHLKTYEEMCNEVLETPGISHNDKLRLRPLWKSLANNEPVPELSDEQKDSLYDLRRGYTLTRFGALSDVQRCFKEIVEILEDMVKVMEENWFISPDVDILDLIEKLSKARIRALLKPRETNRSEYKSAADDASE